MPGNTYVQSQKFHKDLDQKFVIESKSAYLIDNSLVSEFRGNGSIVLTDEVTDGLGSFSKADGYPQGAVTLAQETYRLQQDRATRFVLNEAEVRHTGIDNLVPGLAGRFIKNHVVPEVDSFVFSKGAKIAADNGHLYNGAETLESNPLKILNELINACQDEVGDSEELVCFMNSPFYASLMSTDKINRYIDIGNFKKGSIDTKVKTYNGVGLVKVPSARMKTAYTMKTGFDDQGLGFEASEGAKNIGCLVLPKKRSLMLIKELEKTKYFSPETDDNGDNHRILYHLFYDALCKKSRIGTIFGFTYA